MYPVRRQALDMLRARRLPPLKPWEPHINSMRAMPWDIDPLGDLNNGRIMTNRRRGTLSTSHGSPDPMSKGSYGTRSGSEEAFARSVILSCYHVGTRFVIKC